MKEEGVRSLIIVNIAFVDRVFPDFIGISSKGSLTDTSLRGFEDKTVSMDIASIRYLDDISDDELFNVDGGWTAFTNDSGSFYFIKGPQFLLFFRLTYLLKNEA